MSAVFVVAGVCVAPGRKAEVARIGTAVVSAFGVLALCTGALFMAFAPAWMGACAIAGGVGVYLPVRSRWVPAGLKA